MTGPDNGVDRRTILKGATALTLTLGMGTSKAEESAMGAYVDLDGISIYYEAHGSDTALPPVVLLHGALMSIGTAFAPDLLPRLAGTRRVIAIEAQGHGHTADRDAPLSEEQLVADTVGVLDALGISNADIVGHSMGSITAVGMALRRPDLVRSLTTIGRHFWPDGMLPDLVAMQQGKPPSPALAAILPTQDEFTSWATDYAGVAPDPAGFQRLAGKIQALMADWPGWTSAQLCSLAMPTLIVIGDRDFVRPAHAAEVAALIPGAELAILPGTTHMSALRRGAWLEPMMQARWRDLGA